MPKPILDLIELYGDALQFPIDLEIKLMRRSVDGQDKVKASDPDMDYHVSIGSNTKLYATAKSKIDFDDALNNLLQDLKKQVDSRLDTICQVVGPQHLHKIADSYEKCE